MQFHFCVTSKPSCPIHITSHHITYNTVASDNRKMSEMGMKESQKPESEGTGVFCGPQWGSRGNAPGRGQGAKSPEAEGFAEFKE